MAKTKQYDGTTRLKSLLQEKFVANLLKGMCQTEAYSKAGYKAKAPETGAIQLLRNTNVQARLDYKRGLLAKKCDITAERVIAELAKVGFANIKGYLDQSNVVKDISELPDDVAAAVESVQTDIRHDNGDSDGYTEKVKFKLHSKLAALDQLGRHLGLFEKDKPAEANITINILNYNGNNATI